MFQNQLLGWYRTHRRDLPWRRTRDPYGIWVSEVMLQQTQVDTVIPYYHRFLKAFPNLAALADAPQAKVLKLWEGLGYYARARNLHRAAGCVMREHRGQVPAEWEAFRALPGVGDYIAAAVLSIAFDQPYAVVDGNVKRVLARLLCIDLAVNVQKNHAHFHRQANELLDPSAPADFNQALMEIGALICRPGAPHCDRCPLSGNCCAFRDHTTSEFPHRETRAKTPLRHMAIAVIQRKRKLLLTRRPDKGLLGGLWEFPNVILHPGETPEAGCERLTRQQLDLEVVVGSLLTQIRHAYTHFKIQANVYVCHAPQGRVRLDGPAAFRWITLEQIDNYALPKAVHKLLPALKDHLQPSSRI